MQYPKSGPNLVAEYQVSALPFVTSSTATTTASQISFPFVTSFLTVRNTGATNLKVGFTANGLGAANYFTLVPSASYDGRLRMKDLFLKASSGSTTYEVVAGLTMVERRMFPTLTGSAADGVAAAGADLSTWGYPGLDY